MNVQGITHPIEEESRGESRVDIQTRTYVETIKGIRNVGESESENQFSHKEELKINTTLEGETVRCNFETEQYGVVNYFKEFTVLIHFPGCPLMKWICANGCKSYGVIKDDTLIR